MPGFMNGIETNGLLRCELELVSMPGFMNGIETFTTFHKKNKNVSMPGFMNGIETPESRLVLTPSGFHARIYERD